MNSRYWGETLTELPNLTNSVYKLNNNVRETEKSGVTTTYKTGRACCQVITWLRNPCLVRDSRYIEHESSQDMFTCEACEQSRHVDTWARKHPRHVGTWAFKNARYCSTWARKHIRHVGTRAHKEVRRVGSWACKRTRYVDTSACF